MHDYRDVLFGGHAPEPDDHLLGECKEKMKEIGAQIGIATDGDADRFGIVDEDGTFIQPNYIIALLFDYLVETRGWKNGVAKSVATTNLVNAMAEHHKVPLYETPVGFKYIGELIIADKIAIGGEESAGLTIRGHVPEKDGIIAGLLVTEMVAARGKSLGVQLQELFAKVGSFYPVRENFRLTPEVKAAFTEKLKADPTELSGRKVAKVVRTDGLKLILDDGSWVCYRLSGTEPVVRAYTEARSEKDMEVAESGGQEIRNGVEDVGSKAGRKHRATSDCNDRPEACAAARFVRAVGGLGCARMAPGGQHSGGRPGLAGDVARDQRPARPLGLAAETRGRQATAQGDRWPGAGKCPPAAAHREAQVRSARHRARSPRETALCQAGRSHLRASSRTSAAESAGRQIAAIQRKSTGASFSGAPFNFAGSRRVSVGDSATGGMAESFSNQAAPAPTRGA